MIKLNIFLTFLQMVSFLDSHRYHSLSQNFEVFSEESKLYNDIYINATNIINLRKKRQATTKINCPFQSGPSICSSTSKKYRTIDGSCNNLNIPFLGRKDTPFTRMMKPCYEDGTDEPRKTNRNGDPLLNARFISRRLHSGDEIPTDITILHTYMGQFIDHDLVLTAQTAGENGTRLACKCESTDENCFNIEDIDEVDQKCQVMTRSAGTFGNLQCDSCYREQLNLNTHWLDASQVYGSSDKTINSLRTFQNGLLVISRLKNNVGDYLPFASRGTCIEETSEMRCFRSGDSRTSENMLLVSVHTLWHREHNKLAKSLKRLNPKWNDETLFQEARRILIAEYQHIIYNEWLPILIGKNKYKEKNLQVSSADQYFGSYNENENPLIASEFSTVAFRYGHSCINSKVLKLNKLLQTQVNVSLASCMTRPREAYLNFGLDSICRGLLEEKTLACDLALTDTLQNRLFEVSSENAPTKRFSLSALNIQRGRDHGICSYNMFRSSILKKPLAETFNDFDEIPEDRKIRFKNIFGDVDDIDAFTGGLSEQPTDGLAGPTFSEIIADQFKRLKEGDRFFYENDDCNHKYINFSNNQLNSIKKVTMARILCDNLDLKVVQLNPFLKISSNNPLVNCNAIQSLNLNLWKNEIV